MIGVPERLAMKLVIAVGCALLLVLLVHDRNRWKAKTSHYAELLAAERASHGATAANVRAATERARRADADNAARVRAEQADINERTQDEMDRRLAAARAAAERLRNDPGAAAHRGGGRATPLPSLSAAAGKADETAGQDGFPGDSLLATEQAIQLDELIKWVRAQAQVEISQN